MDDDLGSQDIDFENESHEYGAASGSSPGNDSAPADRFDQQESVFDLTKVPNGTSDDLDQLNHLINNVELYFKAQLDTHKDDFLNAYKGQMEKVKKELEFLQQKKNEANGALMNDTRITSLQTAISWFKNEAILLDSILERQKREVQRQNNQEREKKHTNQFLHKSLKESMRQNKLIQSATERQQKQNDALKVFLRKNAGQAKDSTLSQKQTSQDVSRSVPSNNLSKELAIGGSVTVTNEQQKTQTNRSQYQEAQKAILEVDGNLIQHRGVNPQVDIKIPSSSFAQPILDIEGQESEDLELENQMGLLQLPQTKQQYQEFRKMARHDLSMKASQQNKISQSQQGDLEPDITSLIENLLQSNLGQEKEQEQITNFFKAHDDFKEDQILRLQANLDNQKSKNKKLRNMQASAFSDKSELQNLFLDCVDENRKDVLRHFTNSHATNSSTMNTRQQKKTSNIGNISSKILIDQVCTSAQSKTLIFQALFGADITRQSEMKQSAFNFSDGNIEHGNQKLLAAASQDLEAFDDASQLAYV